jgi:hypothetical protein
VLIFQLADDLDTRSNRKAVRRAACYGGAGIDYTTAASMVRVDRRSLKLLLSVLYS